MNPDLIKISRATDEDFEFSYQAKKAVEGDLIQAVFGWDEAFQRAFHLKDWTQNRPDIIRYDGRPIGTLLVVEGDGRLQIGRFFILPEHQNQGIGTFLLQRVLRRADERGLVAQLAYLKGNRAEALYVRHGFRLISQSETHCFAERRPCPVR